jgi:hypothetical protein
VSPIRLNQAVAEVGMDRQIPITDRNAIPEESVRIFMGKAGSVCVKGPQEKQRQNLKERIVSIDPE